MCVFFRRLIWVCIKEPWSDEALMSREVQHFSGMRVCVATGDKQLDGRTAILEWWRARLWWVYVMTLMLMTGTFTCANNIPFAKFSIRIGINNLGGCLVNLMWKAGASEWDMWGDESLWDDCLSTTSGPFLEMVPPSPAEVHSTVSHSEEVSTTWAGKNRLSLEGASIGLYV